MAAEVHVCIGRSHTTTPPGRKTRPVLDSIPTTSPKDASISYHNFNIKEIKKSIGPRVSDQHRSSSRKHSKTLLPVNTTTTWATPSVITGATNVRHKTFLPHPSSFHREDNYPAPLPSPFPSSHPFATPLASKHGRQVSPPFNTSPTPWLRAPS